MLTLTLALLLASEPSPGVEADLATVRAVDLDGLMHRIGYDRRARAAALVFLGVECPVSQRFAPRLNELAREAEERGLAFFGVISDASVAPARAREFARAHELAFPVLYDAAEIGRAHV